MSVPQKVVSHASASSGEVLRNGLTGYRVRPKRRGSVSKYGVIERLREQIRCIEGRTPVLDPDISSGIESCPGLIPKSVQSPGRFGSTGPDDDLNHQKLGASGVQSLQGQSAPEQAGFPAARFAPEDGGAFPRNPLPPAPPSSPSSCLPGRQITSKQSTPTWTLGTLGHECAPDVRPEITQLPLDLAGVHEIKPALFNESGLSDHPDWAASWSAARTFLLALIARRKAGCDKPVLWCMPHAAKAEHGALYGHGLKRFGLTPSDILVVETGNAQDTLWTLEEGIKSQSLALVAGFIDDVMLTPARRLALATVQHKTPCLLLTHPRMPPAGATVTRWRCAARSGASHPLCAPHQLHTSSSMSKALGAPRFALTLERYRAAPEYITGREFVVEWSDEAVCVPVVADLPDRSYAQGTSGIGTA